MNKLENILLQELYEHEFEEIPNSALYKFDYEEAAKQITKITTDVVIKFTLFLKNDCFVDIDPNDKSFWNYKGTPYYEPHELFDYFINNHYEK